MPVPWVCDVLSAGVLLGVYRPKVDYIVLGLMFLPGYA